MEFNRKCQNCHGEVSTEAIVCKHCGYKLSNVLLGETEQKKRFKSPQDKKNLNLALLLMAGLIVVAIPLFAIIFWLSDITTPVPQEQWIMAHDLYVEYEKNPIAADQKYKGKTILVGGYVDEINRELLGNIYVALDVGHYLGCVQCLFSDRHKTEIARLTKGQKIVIKGKCRGKTALQVLVDNCSVSSITGKLDQQ